MAAESKLETSCRKHVEWKLDGKIVKLVSPGNNGWPDRALLIPGCPVVFIEFKAPGKVLSTNQRRWRRWLTDHGFNHWVIRLYWDFITAVNELEASNAKR